MTLLDRLLAITGVIPPFLLLWLAERFERRVREPTQGFRYRVLAAAGLSSIPIAWAERYLSQWITGAPEPLATLFESLVVAGAMEEIGKGLCVYLLTRGALAPRTRYGAFLYALHASMGFALVENVIAMLRVPGLMAFTTRFILRAYMTVPMHLVAGGLVGYFWATRRFDAGRLGLSGGVAIAIMIHGLYNALLLGVERLPSERGTLQFAFAAGAMAIPLVGAVVLRLLAGRLSERDSNDGRAPGGARERAPERLRAS